MPEVTRDHINHLLPEVAEIPLAVRSQLENDALYQQYLDRQKNDVEALRKDENTLLPAELHYVDMPGLSKELAGKLERRRPETLAQAAQIEGMTPAGLALILAHLRKSRRVSGQ